VAAVNQRCCHAKALCALLLLLLPLLLLLLQTGHLE
jgi:hypothetical protein